MLRGYNPTVTANDFYPTTSAMQTIRSTVGSAQTLTQGLADMYPSVNLWYRVHSPETYDALGVREYDDLYRKLLDPPKPPGAFESTEGYGSPRSLDALQGLGVAYIATNFEYPYAKSVLTVPIRASRFAVLPAGHTVTSSISAHDKGFDELLTAGPPGRFGQACHLLLNDGKSGTLLRRATSPCGQGMAAFSFAPFPNGVGRTFSVTVWSGEKVGRPTPGAVVVDGIQTFTPGLLPVAHNHWLYVFRVPGVERYSAPARAITAHDPSSATRLLLTRGFNPNETVAVEADAGPPDRAAGHVTVVSEQPTSTRLHVTRSGAGWVLARISDFPGWHATVNGHAAKIVAADAAFMAVRVPAGTSDVAFDYRPVSVMIGLIVTGASAAALFAIALGAVLRRRSRRAQRGSPDPVSTPSSVADRRTLARLH